MMRPPLGLGDGRQTEIGAAAVAVSPPPFTVDPWFGAGQVWVRHRSTRRPLVTLSGIGGFDLSAAFVGGGLTIHYVEHPVVVGAVDVSGGYGWINLSLPVVIRLFDGGWFYTAPRLGNWGPDPTIFLLGGLDFRIKGGWHVRTESQVSWQSFHAYERRHHVALGLAYQL